MFIDQKEPIQVEKASNDSFLKTFNLTKCTLMYHCDWPDFRQQLKVQIANDGETLCLFRVIFWGKVDFLINKQLYGNLTKFYPSDSEGNLCNSVEK